MGRRADPATEQRRRLEEETPPAPGKGASTRAVVATSLDAKVQAAVDALAANCGEHVRDLILSGHPLLPEAKVLQLSRTTPERQRYELDQVQQGRAPFSTRSTVFDTTGYGEVGSRLARFGGKVHKAAQVLHQLFSHTEPPWEVAAALREAAETLLRHCSALRRLVLWGYKNRPTGADDAARGYRWRPARSWEDLQADELTVGAAQGCLRQAAGGLAKCVRDLGQAQEKDLWPSRDQAHSITVRLYGIVADTREVLAVIGAEGPGAPSPRGPSGQVRPRVATHTRPDVDALVAVWLVERYLFECKVELVFLPYRHDWARGPALDCVVDMGGMHDPGRLLFDHKPPAFADRGQTCAARLVWEHLLALGRPVGHLAELVRTVHAGDSAALRPQSTAYRASKRAGLHAHFDRAKAAGRSEVGLYRVLWEWLDRYDGEQRCENQQVCR